MTLQEFFRAVLRRWWAVVLITAVGVAGAALYTEHLSAQYRSSVTFFVATPSSGSSTAYQASQYAQQRVDSYVKLLSSEQLAQRVVAASGSRETPAEVAKNITGSAPINTVILTANVTAGSSAEALRLSQAVADVFGPMVEELDRTTTNGSSSVTLSVVSGPTAPARVGPSRKLNLILGAIVGLALGLLVVALRDLADSSVKSADEFAELFEWPVLARIRGQRHRHGALIGAGSNTAMAEEFRQLRTALQFVPSAASASTIAVVSPRDQDGRSSVAINLGVTLAEAGKSVVLVDADLRQPAVGTLLGLDDSKGLSNVLAGDVELDDALQRWQDSLTVLSAGPIPPNPAELLSGSKMSETLSELRSRFDYVLLDTPPLGVVTDAVIAAAQAHGVILVVRVGRTNPRQIKTAGEAVGQVRTPVLGCVLTNVKADRGARAAMRRLQRRPKAERHDPRTATTTDVDSGVDADVEPAV